MVPVIRLNPYQFAGARQTHHEECDHQYAPQVLTYFQPLNHHLKHHQLIGMMLTNPTIGLYPFRCDNYKAYPPTIKHGLLENPSFTDDTLTEK